MTPLQRLVAFVSVGCVFASGAALADDTTPKRPWTDAADFGLTLTTGNAQNLNFALGNKFKYSWSNSELTFDVGALRNENKITTYTYDGTSLTKTEDSTVTAESYFAALKYRRDITKRFYWLAGTGWFRNTFAGIDERFLAGAGVGYAFIKDDKNLLRGEAGVDYTHQEPVVTDKDYASLHLYLGYEYKISDTAKLTEDLNILDNLQHTSDWRANSLTAVTASLTSKLAIKVSYAILYVNEPALFKTIPSTGGGPNPSIDVLYKKTDTILQAALVVNF